MHVLAVLNSNSTIVPFAIDTLDNFGSVAITFLQAIVAKTKFAIDLEQSRSKKACFMKNME